MSKIKEKFWYAIVPRSLRSIETRTADLRPEMIILVWASELFKSFRLRHVVWMSD